MLQAPGQAFCCTSALAYSVTELLWCVACLVQRVASLEASKAELEGQLSGLAALVAQLEARLREVTAQSHAASTAAELAAATAAQAQAAVGEQVGLLAARNYIRYKIPCVLASLCLARKSTFQ